MNCVDDSVRLVGGSSDLEGRVEICNNGVWISVHPYGWHYGIGDVVCRQLGHGYRELFLFH